MDSGQQKGKGEEGKVTHLVHEDASKRQAENKQPWGRRNAVTPGQAVPKKRAQKNEARRDSGRRGGEEVEGKEEGKKEDGQTQDVSSQWLLLDREDAEAGKREGSNER